MSRFPLGDVLDGTGGELRGALPSGHVFTTLQRDARLIGPGDLYLAIRGERHDGNTFTPDAAARGAAAAIVSREWAATWPEPSLPLIVVEDTTTALQRWAAWRRRRLSATVIGVTGSVGKTSAKESIAAVLGHDRKTHRSPGSYNNEIGLPLSLLEADEDAEAIVLEMGGAYAHGEITLLAGIAQPRIGVVTNVHPVHLERMGTIEAIARTKTELPAALPADGIAVLNGDDPRVRAMADATVARVVFYGTEPHNDVRADAVVTEGLNGSAFGLTVDGERREVAVPFAGTPGVQVALVALAVGHAVGLRVPDMVEALQDRRIQVRLRISAGMHGSALIDDTYNASTPSMLSALSLLENVPATRRIAVLGDMRELGHDSDAQHRIVGRAAAGVVDVLLTYGESARSIAEAAQRATGGPRVASFAESERDRLVAMARHELREGDIVLVKGSRGLTMETIVRDLRADPGERDARPEGSA